MVCNLSYKITDFNESVNEKNLVIYNLNNQKKLHKSKAIERLISKPFTREILILNIKKQVTFNHN